MDDMAKTLSKIISACRNKEFISAKMLCDQLEKMFPMERARVFWFRSIIAEREGCTDDERNFIMDAIRIHNGDRGIISGYVDFLIRNGEIDNAVEWLNILLITDESLLDTAFTQDAHARLTYCYYVKGERNTARRHLSLVGALFDMAPVRFSPMLTFMELKALVANMGEAT